MSGKVELYVYDISMGLGVYHTSVVVYDIEFAYYSEGVVIRTKGESSTRIPKKIEYMGETRCSFNEVLDNVYKLSKNQFRASEYDIYRNNCIDFCKVLVKLLCDGVIPGYVQIAPKLGRSTAIGQFLKPLFASCASSKENDDGENASLSG